jgi:hypothetical protein
MRKIETPTLATTTTLTAHDLAAASGGMPFGFGGKDKTKESKDNGKHKEPKQSSGSHSSSSYDARASRDPWMKSARDQRGMSADKFFNTGAPKYRYY